MAVGELTPVSRGISNSNTFDALSMEEEPREED